MPRFTEHRIKDLCQEAVAVPTEDIKDVLAKLRHAIDEHISLAKVSLEAQASVIPLLESRKKKHSLFLIAKCLHKS